MIRKKSQIKLSKSAIKIGNNYSKSSIKIDRKYDKVNTKETIQKLNLNE